MTDSRPSENTDDRPFEAVAEYGREHLGWFDSPIQELGFETADAQHIVAALDRQTEQQRIANLLQFQHMFPFAHPELRDEIEKAMGLS